MGLYALFFVSPHYAPIPAKISNEAVKHLRKLNVIEGKLPNIYVSANVAEQLDEKA